MNLNHKNDYGYFRIEYLIGLFILFRLIGITNAPLEIAHNWRQVTGLMVSRNFLEIDPSIWLPRVDETNGLTGIIGMEFPLLNYFHYLFSLLFDYQHWYGRVINLIVTSTGIYFFYKLIKDRLSDKTAYYATVFLLGSIWFIYSRKMMPDTFSMSLAFIGLYFGNQYLKNQNWKKYMLFVLFLSLGFLSKISAVICVAAIPFLMNEFHSIKSRIWILLGLGFSLMLTYLWYFQWNPYLSETYGNWYNSGTDMKTGLNELYQNVPETLKRIYFSSFQSYLAFAILIVSTLYLWIKKETKILLFLFTASIVFGAYMAKSGAIFYIHSYYIIPIVPVFCIVIGRFLCSLKNQKIAISLCVLFLVESLANQQHDLFVKTTEKYKLSLEQIASDHIHQNDLIATNGNGNPQELYLSHRKGFVVNNEDLSTEKIKALKKRGCKFLIINRHTFKKTLKHSLIFKNKDYEIYDIND